MCSLVLIIYFYLSAINFHKITDTERQQQKKKLKWFLSNCGKNVTPANFYITLFPPCFSPSFYFLPMGLPTLLSAKSLIWRWRWGSYWCFGHSDYYYILYCGSSNLSLPLWVCLFKLPEAWCYSVFHTGGRTRDLDAGKDLSC